MLFKIKQKDIFFVEIFMLFWKTRRLAFWNGNLEACNVLSM